jgi:transcriptional regulator of aromatic amino acid metabolism
MQPVRTDRGLHFTSQPTSPQLGREALGFVDVRTRAVAQAFDFETIADATLMRCLLAGARRPNLLAQCASALDAEAFIERFAPWCAGPLYACPLPRVLSLPAAPIGTLLLNDVATLSVVQQLELFDWISERKTATQIVSVTTRPLTPLVDAGLFLQSLFYRLNIIQLNASPVRARERRHRLRQ